MESEEKLFARLFYNFEGKRPKKDSLIYLANQCLILKKKYGSVNAVADKIGVSYENIRELLKLLDLDKDVQKLVDERKIAYDAAWRLAEITNRELQKAVASAIIGLDAHSAREVVRYSKLNKNSDPKEYVKKLIKSKTHVSKIKLLILPLDEEKYNYLKIESNRKHKSVSDFLLDMIEHNIGK
jgi:ParB-like chromosome segregation protein Spo0J